MNLFKKPERLIGALCSNLILKIRSVNQTTQFERYGSAQLFGRHLCVQTDDR